MTLIPTVGDTYHIKPAWKAVGGKGKIAARICNYFYGSIREFYEPFYGGGAVTLELYRTGRLHSAQRVVANDFDPSIKLMCEAIAAEPKLFAANLYFWETKYYKNPEETYYQIRQEWNDGIHQTLKPAHAAKCLFLRQAGYNGLWRVNKNGKMNTPWGKYKKVHLPPLDQLFALAKLYGKMRFDSQDFAQHVEDEIWSRFDMNLNNVCVFMDPPYLKTYSQYVKSGWGVSDAERLVCLCQNLAYRGATVVLSHIDNDAIREVLKDFWPTAKLIDIDTRHTVNCDGKGRGKVRELLITNSEAA